MWRHLQSIFENSWKKERISVVQSEFTVGRKLITNMGTNFYAVKVPTELEYARMQEALTERQLERLRELIDRAEVRYHIGKRSNGWQFLFCANDERLAPWKPTREDLDAFLHRNDIIIESEYGKQFTPEEFWKEIEDCLYHDPEHYINGADADKKNPHSFYKLTNMEFTTKESLRWSCSADFS